MEQDLNAISKAWDVLASVDYSFYLEYIHDGKYKHGKHTRYIADKLEAVERGEIKRLMIFLPPRHSKSMTTSETFPSYFIGKNKDRRVILTSYGDDLARQFGRANLNKLESKGLDIFDLTIASNNSSTGDWGVDGYRGGMVSTGIGGAITGKGADLLIIDDPIKNREEADSKTYRDKVWNEWQNTLYTRLQPGGAVILIMTRWHEDDLAGRLLSEEYGEVEDWEIINLPAEAEEDDLLGREPGEPLSPERGYGKEWIAKTKKAVGTRVWTALYQQRPTPTSGNIVSESWWQFYDELPEDLDLMLQSWDLAVKASGTSYTVGQVWATKGADRYLVDQVRGKYSFTQMLQAIRNLTRKYPEAKLKLIEDKANGPAVINTLRKEIGGIVPIQPKGSKEVRAQAITPEIEAGNVYLPRPSRASWIREYLQEWQEFPNGSNDDQVDTTTQALERLTTFNTTRENHSGKGRR